MRNERKINLANCNFNFQNKNSSNTNEVKATALNSFGAVQLQENLRTAKQASGITLIALVVTIVVLLILAGVSISTVLGNNGIIPRANESKFKTDLANIQEEFNLYVMDKTGENGDFSVGTLNASSNLLTYNTQPEEEKGTGNISTVLKSSTAQKYIQSKSFSIIKGDLIYASQNAKELEWAQEVGLEINPYNIDENGVLLSSETNLMLVDESTGTLVIPEMVKAIGEGAFANVKGVKKIIIPPTVNEIGMNAFRGNTEIEEVIIQTKEEMGVTKIGNHAFRGCSKLIQINLPNTINSLGDGAFWDCSGLQEVTLSSNLTAIKSHAFVNTYKLKKIDIPEGITSIESRAFYNSGLTEISIPASVTSIEGGCFSGIRTIRNVNINEENNSFKYNDGILSTKDGRYMILVTIDAIEGNTFTIPEGVINLTDGILLGYTEITKIVIPSSLEYINTEGFNINRVHQFEMNKNNPNFSIINGGIYSKDRTTLNYYFANNSEVVISEGTKTIGTKAIRFGKSFVLPETLEEIRKQGITGIACNNIKFGKNLKTIYGVSTYLCNIENIEISDENPNFIAEGPAIYNKDKSKIILHGKCNAPEINIPSGVRIIGEQCFYNHGGLREVNMPNTIETIENYVFADSGITRLEIPSSVTSIASEAFLDTSKLTEVIIDKEKGSIPGSPWGTTIGERAIKWLR